MTSLPLLFLSYCLLAGWGLEAFQCPLRCQCYRDEDPRSGAMHLICKWDRLNTTNLDSVYRKDMVRTLTIRCPHHSKRIEQQPPAGLFRGLWKLDRLEIDRCRLNRVPEELFAGLHQLYSLVLRNALLPELPRELFAHLPNLMTLDLSGNQLRIEPNSLSSLRSLIHLDLSNNSIAFLANTMASLTKLKVLTLDHNQLTNIDFRRLPEELTDLSLRHNLINTIHFVPNSARALRRLDLAGNKLDFVASFGSVNVLPPGLHSVDLSMNRINHLQENAFKPLDQLVLLNLRNNSLTELLETTFAGPRVAMRLMLADNPFDCTCSLRWMFHHSPQNKADVTILDIQQLKCRHVTRRNKFMTLKQADSTNQLMCKYATTCPPRCDCCHQGPADCPCVAVCPSGCICHESATARTNRTIHNSVRCDTLRLDAVPQLPQTITALTFRSVDWKDWPPIVLKNLSTLRSLTSLTISESRLSNEEAEWLGQLDSLTELDLSSNQITELRRRPPHLRRLDLSNNPLSDLPGPDILNGLVSISLAGNRTEFTCDCAAPSALQVWLGSLANNAKVEDLDDVECDLEGAGRVSISAVLSVNESLCDLLTTTEATTTERIFEVDEIFGTQEIITNSVRLLSAVIPTGLTTSEETQRTTATTTIKTTTKWETIQTTQRSTTTPRKITTISSSTTQKHKHKFGREKPEENQFLDILIILLVISIVLLLIAISATFYYRLQQMREDQTRDEAREPL